MLGLSLVSGPLQFVRHLLGLLIGTQHFLAYLIQYNALFSFSFRLFTQYFMIGYLTYSSPRQQSVAPQ